MKIKIRDIYNFIGVFLLCALYFFETPISLLGTQLLIVLQIGITLCFIMAASVHGRISYSKKVYPYTLMWIMMIPFFLYGLLHSEIATAFLKCGGIVYGCEMDNSNQAVYKRIDHIEKLEEIKGSKYVQAKLGNTYAGIEADLKLGRIVLFSGTPCYVMAVKQYFSRSKFYYNLYTVDLICHGVPSPRVYNSYLHYLERKMKSKIKEFIFRDKIGGWHKHVEKIIYENGKIEYRDGYTQLFYTNLPLRRSCGECPFSTIKRCGDFTVGDFWGVQDVLPEFDDNKGVSLLFFNNDRALERFDSFKEMLKYQEISVTDAVRQPNLKGHSVIPKNVNAFWRDFQKKGIGYCISFYSPAGIPFRIKRKIKYIYSKVTRK